MFLILFSEISKSFMNMLNKMGLDLYPYGTEQFTLILLDYSFILTVIEDNIWERRRYSFDFFGMIYANFLSSNLCGMVSNAFLKSKKAAILFYFFCLLSLSWLRINSR